ncbi:hypothetical protein ACET6E_07970 [Aeromonas caviae]|uniref:hypothetical protein n=1 Tax=Aeromonas TaxID=642 RepID=UPI001F53E2EA|nr:MULTISPECIES: hypothetical protein [Aeromonas]MCR3931298.1 hypothetical protein [Aeromonas caviae]UUT59015.1 hypothetical protein MOO40_17905 [Aeromonas hydrophila]
MAKKQDFRPPQLRIDKLIATHKTISLAGLKWGLKPPPGRSPIWLQLPIAVLDSDGIPMPGLEIRVIWRPSEGEHSDGYGDAVKMNFVLLYQGVRIRALDTYPFDRHTNRCSIPGMDLLPTILGPHLHFYVESVVTEEPAKPVDSQLKHDDINGYWRYFCIECNIDFPGDLPTPGAKIEPQMRLEL